jgi:hypothetical protein
MKEFQIGILFVFKLTMNKLFRCNLFKLSYLANNHDYKKQVHFEAGGSYCFYHFGIAQAIYELYPREVLDRISWTGSSAGNIPYLSLQLPTHPPKKSFEYCVDNALVHLNKLWGGGFYSINEYFERTYYHYINQYADCFLQKKSNLFPAALHYNWVCPLLSYLSFSHNFETEKEIVDSCLASHAILFITGNLKYSIISHPTKWYIWRVDGGLLTIPLGYLFGYSAIMPYGQRIPSGVIKVDTFRGLTPIHLWLWTSPTFAKSLFQKGYNDAMANRKLLDELIR